MRNENSTAPPLTEAEAAAIEARVKALEARVGVQVVAAVVERSDVYHGLRWRAFAIGTSLAGVGGVVLGRLRPDAPAEIAVPVVLALVVCAGMATALVASLAPGFARLFLEPLRADAEIRRQAESLFLRHELFQTRGRDAVLILASRYERRSAVFADRGLSGHVSDDSWNSVTARMNPLLAAGRTADALLAGIDAAEPLLFGHSTPDGGGAANELPNRPITAEGPR